MRIKKVIAAHEEMQKLPGVITCAIAARDAAMERLNNDHLTSKEWAEAATEYAFQSGVIRRSESRIRILRGRIHFEATTA